MIVLFNKPFRVLSQFTTEGDKAVLADYIDIPGVYCAGRLDYDSEGLLVLTDDGKLQQRIANPAYGADGLTLMRQGQAAQQVLDRLAAADADRAYRQVAMIDALGVVGQVTRSRARVVSA